MSSRNSRSTVALELRGLLLLLVLGGLIALSIASYDKAFSNDIRVDAHVPRTGLQLNKNGDVRVRGALVGRITGIDTQGAGAVIHMAIDPSAAAGIPDNATVAILPTTLFGQKFVDLVPPVHASGETLVAGDVLHADSSAAPLEISTVLDHLQPVLTAVRPHDLAVTLSALADGLRGRGAKLGALITDSKNVLTTFNAHLPLAVSDLKDFAALSNTWADVSPNLIATLSNVTATSRTLVTYNREFTALLATGAQFATDFAGLLTATFDPLVSAVASSTPVLALFARYAPEYACLFHGLDGAQAAVERTVQRGQLQVHIVLGAQANGYTAKDRPRYGDVGRGPACANLPNPPASVGGFTGANDGVGGR